MKQWQFNLILISIILLIVGACYFIAYQIAASDVPDWFKFFLLR